MNFKKLLVAALLSGLSVAAHAETITFEDVTLYSQGVFNSGSFTFNLSGMAAAIVQGQYCGPACPVNGTNIALVPYDYSQGFLSMQKTGGGAFSLTSFDGAGSFNFNESGLPSYIPQQIDVVGITAGGASVTQSFAIDRSTPSGPLAFRNFSFDNNFNNVVSVSFRSSGSAQPIYNGLAVDNINAAAPVPEPETWAMMGLGLAALAFEAKRRKAA